MKTNSTSISLILEVIKEAKWKRKKVRKWKAKEQQQKKKIPPLYFTEDIVSDLWYLQAI